MNTQTRREREREDTRNKILDAARELFAEKGYDAVTMRSIAEKIDYTPTAIYFHFADKETLIREICDHDFLVFARELAPGMAISDPLERLAAVGQLYVGFALRHPHHYRLMFMSGHPAKGNPEQSALRQGDPTQDAYAFLRQCVQEALASGALREEFEDADLAAQTLWAGLHGVISLYLTMGQDTWIAWAGLPRAAQAMEDAIMRGLCKPGGRGRG